MATLAPALVFFLVTSSGGLSLEDHAAASCPAGRPLTRCETFLFELGKQWVERAHVENAKLKHCKAHLASRTPAAVAASTPPEPLPDLGPGWPLALVLVVASAALGVAGGVLVGMQL